MLVLIFHKEEASTTILIYPCLPLPECGAGEGEEGEQPEHRGRHGAGPGGGRAVTLADGVLILRTAVGGDSPAV